MANICVEYRQHRNPDNSVSDPNWMSDGGYLHDPDTQTYVGFLPVDSDRDWYVPDGLVQLTQTQFVQRGESVLGKGFLPVSFTENRTIALPQSEVTSMLTELYASKTQ